MQGQQYLSWQEDLFSPGKLAQLHRFNNGKRIQCVDCHRPGEKISNADCQKCHGEAWFEAERKTLSQSHRRMSKRSCLECHFEHKGYSAVITKPFREKEHQALPAALRNTCVMCHLAWRETRHPSMTNYNCNKCHSYVTWKTVPLDHAVAPVKPKTVSAKAPYLYCYSCHAIGYHSTDPTKPNPVEQCRICHWRKQNTKYLPPGYDYPDKHNYSY